VEEDDVTMEDLDVTDEEILLFCFSTPETLDIFVVIDVVVVVVAVTDETLDVAEAACEIREPAPSIPAPGFGSTTVAFTGFVPQGAGVTADGVVVVLAFDAAPV
jgi:hypothetical protein